jgi:hypothetical protein
MLDAQQFTRGIGVYPGDPKENFAPEMAIDSTYRNLARLRPAYHSSSYDYNLTAQLVTDGIKDSALPRWVSTATSDAGVLKRHERELILDDNLVSTVELRGPRGWIQLELGGGTDAPEVDRVDVRARAQFGRNNQAAGWTVIVSGSDDGQAWKELGRATGTDRPGFDFKPSVALSGSSRSRFYRVELAAPGTTSWRVSEVSLFNQGSRVRIGGPYVFTSAWMSAGAGEEWVSVDLGAPCTFDRVALYWIRRAAEASIQVSDDAGTWTTVQALPPSSDLADDLKLAQPAKGRYVRVLMTRPASPEGYILSELEVYGRGGPVPKPRPALSLRGTGKLDLGPGAWRVQRDSLIAAGGDALSKPGFQDRDWLVATVPGTVLTSYLNAGAVPDLNYGDNQLMISDSYFQADFWYRTEFTMPRTAAGRHLWLNFDGINWKADVFLNGEKIGRIEGAFIRGRFDVTGRVRPGANALAVRIEKVATPGSTKEKTALSPGLNGGALGADNPTYHASIGWDWIPPVRGRNTGIWAGVYLDSTGPVAIESPLVSTTLPLPDTSRADVSIEATLRNLEPKPVTGTLRGRFGDRPFELPVTIEASSAKTVKQALQLANPKLWWPVGYGEPNLYPVELRFMASGAVSDSKSFQAGVRQFTYSEDGGALRIWINGRRFIPRGGNWGFPESMLRYRSREYEAAARYHRDMNFTMVRDWVGQIGDDAFYEACDRNGVVIWQDFWLANPADGPNPDDNDMFLRNARDTLLRIRNHPSIGLYCGRNEGNPPKPIEAALRVMVPELHPGLHYIPHSSRGPVSGEGPYRALPPKRYFEQPKTKLHSEMGMPNIVTFESLRMMMPESAMWPHGHTWGLHDFALEGAQGARSFHEIIDKGYGGANSAAQWVMLAQFVNYDGYRAMFEAQGANRMGLLLWMSHPAWPSFVWQTYDYYLEPTAAYFGCKKASEPLHIQWNQAADTVEVVNYSGGNASGLTARVEVLNMDGSVKWEKTVPVDSAEDSTLSLMKLEYPADLTPVHFVRLTLSRGNSPVSTNFYLRALKGGDYTAIRQLPKVNLEATTRVERQGGRWLLSTGLRNVSSQPALMVRLKVVREKSGDRILPAIYSDNYFALMPGESRTLRSELEHADTRGEQPRMVVEGFNVGEVLQK